MVTKYPPMTRADLAQSLEQIVDWNVFDGVRKLVIRLVTEIHRLHLKTRLQRRTIAELRTQAPTTLDVAEIEGAKVLPEATAPADDFTIALGAGGTEDTAIGRFWGLFNVDSEGDPLVLFPSRDEAERYLNLRQAADPEGDDYLSHDWTVLRVDAVLSVLNSIDPDPFPDLSWPPRFAIRSLAELRTLQMTKRVAPAT